MESLTSAAAAAAFPPPGLLPLPLPPRRPMASSASASATPGTANEALFHQQAVLYAQYRPDYPPALYDAVLQCAALPRRTLAVDVGTGSGQVAAALAGHFDRVLASDATQKQLDHAVRRHNITYFRAPAERLERVASGTVDLLTAAQGLHWWAAARGKGEGDVRAWLVWCWEGGGRGEGAAREGEGSCLPCLHTLPTCPATLRSSSKHVSACPALHPSMPQTAPACCRFDAPAFYAEARRVLQPGGTLAVWGKPAGRQQLPGRGAPTTTSLTLCPLPCPPSTQSPSLRTPACLPACLYWLPIHVPAPAFPHCSGYGLPFFCNPPGRTHAPAALAALRRALQEMHTATLGAHWDSRRWLVDNSYRGLEPTACQFGSVLRRDDLRMHKDLSVAAVVSWRAVPVFGWVRVCAVLRMHGMHVARLSSGRVGAVAGEAVCGLEDGQGCRQLASWLPPLRPPGLPIFHPPSTLPPAHPPPPQLGYVASWSAYAAYRRQHPQAPDPLAAFSEQLLAALGMGEEEAAAAATAGEEVPVLRLEWPLFIILAKDPLPLPAAGGYASRVGECAS